MNQTVMENKGSITNSMKEMYVVGMTTGCGYCEALAIKLLKDMVLVNGCKIYGTTKEIAYFLILTSVFDFVIAASQVQMELQTKLQ